MGKGIFFGLNTIDLQFLIDSDIAPNQKYKARKNGIYTGGPATNAAVTYSHLGGRAGIITPVGNHEFSGFITSELTTLGVELIDPLYNQVSKPVFATVVTAKHTGDRSVFSYHPDNLPGFSLNGEAQILQNADFLLIDGFFMGQAIYLAEKAAALNVPVIFDGGSWKDGTEDLLPYVDVCIASADFFPPGIDNPKQTLEYLIDKQINKAAVTRGEKSILYQESKTSGEIHIPETEVVDTLGAGDIFHGAFCYYYSITQNFVQSLLEASEVASESCRYFGTRQWMQRVQEVNE